MRKNRLLNFNSAAPDLSLKRTSGRSVRLSTLWKKKPLILAFTRHFGCTQCKEMLDELVRGKSEIEAAGMGVAVVTQGSPETTALFVKEFGPGLLALSDPERRAYKAYGLERGNIFETVLNWKVIRAVRRAREKGFFLEEPPEGQDAMQMSGTFVIGTNGRVLLPYYYDNIADHPPLDLLLSGVLSTGWDKAFEGPVGPNAVTENGESK